MMTQSAMSEVGTAGNCHAKLMQNRTRNGPPPTISTITQTQSKVLVAFRQHSWQQFALG